MKLVINYDLANRIFDIKNKGKYYVIMKRSIVDTVKNTLPFLFILNALASRGDLKHTMLSLIDWFIVKGILNIIVEASPNPKKIKEYLVMFQRIDRQVSIEENELSALAYKLSQLNIDVSYKLLLDAYVYNKAYDFEEYDDKKKLVEKKYFNIPCNDGQDEVSIVQEHAIGSKDYVLSLGSPSPRRVLALQGA